MDIPTSLIFFSSFIRSPYNLDESPLLPAQQAVENAFLDCESTQIADGGTHSAGFFR